MTPSTRAIASAVLVFLATATSAGPPVRPPKANGAKGEWHIRQNFPQSLAEWVNSVVLIGGFIGMGAICSHLGRARARTCDHWRATVLAALAGLPVGLAYGLIVGQFAAAFAGRERFSMRMLALGIFGFAGMAFGFVAAKFELAQRRRNNQEHPGAADPSLSADR